MGKKELIRRRVKFKHWQVCKGNKSRMMSHDRDGVEMGRERLFWMRRSVTKGLLEDVTFKRSWPCREWMGKAFQAEGTAKA